MVIAVATATATATATAEPVTTLPSKDSHEVASVPTNVSHPKTDEITAILDSIG